MQGRAFLSFLNACELSLNSSIGTKFLSAGIWSKPIEVETKPVPALIKNFKFLKKLLVGGDF